MKKTLILLMVVGFVLSLIGCSSSDSPDEPTTSQISKDENTLIESLQKELDDANSQIERLTSKYNQLLVDYDEAQRTISEHENTDMTADTESATTNATEETMAPAVDFDFFSDTARCEKYNSLFQSYKYNELYSYVKQYITDFSPASTDSAYTITSLIEPFLEYEDKWTVSTDDFDSSMTLIFDGAADISGSTSIAMSLEKNHLEYKVGFEKSNWLFFDEVRLSSDGEVIYSSSFKSYDVTRDVISGNTIREYGFCSFGDKVSAKLSNANTVILRFQNSKSGEAYDHTLTQSEIDSLYYGPILQETYIELSNLLFRYNNPSD